MSSETNVALIVPFVHSFPFDVMLKIISSLDHKSLISLSKTSKDFNNEANRILWRVIRITSLSRFRNRFVGSSGIARLASHVRDLEISPTDLLLHNVSTCVEFAHVLRSILASLHNLRHLALHIPNYQQHIMTSVLAEDVSSFSLTSLILHGDVAPCDANLQRFLAVHPKIEKLSLKLGYNSRTNIPQSFYAPGVLPALRSIEASPELIAHLVPHRPIESVDATCHVMRQRDLAGFIQALSSSTESIQTLALNFQEYTERTPVVPSLALVAQAFPRLRALKVLYTLFTDVDIDLPNVLGMFPMLEVFSCKCMLNVGGYFDCIPEDVVDLVRESESLKRVVYTSAAYGRREWEKSEGSEEWVKVVDETGRMLTSALRSARFSR